jgi:hypothetical protein
MFLDTNLLNLNFLKADLNELEKLNESNESRKTSHANCSVTIT